MRLLYSYLAPTLLLFVTLVHSQKFLSESSIALLADADTTIFGGSVNNSGPSLPTIFAGVTNSGSGSGGGSGGSGGGGGNGGGSGSGSGSGSGNNSPSNRALIYFKLKDVNEITAGDGIKNATLRLTVVKTSASEPTEFAIHRVVLPGKRWQERGKITEGGGSGVPAETRDATWLMSRFGQTAWETEGGDFVEEPSATFTAGLSGEITDFVDISFSADIRNMLKKPRRNRGWLIKAVDETVSQTARSFGSRESDTPPQLSFVYKVRNCPTMGIRVCTKNTRCVFDSDLGCIDA